MTLLAAAAAVTLARERTSRWGRYIAPLALFDLAIFPASYLARGFPLEDLGIGFYWGFTLGVAAVIAAAATVAGRRTRRPSVALAAVLALVSDRKSTRLNSSH